MKKTTRTTANTANSHSKSSRWIISYDISDRKRLSRTARYLVREGIRIQYSIYLLKATASQIQTHIDEILQRIDPAQDDVRIYPITTNARIWQLGILSLPQHDEAFTLTDPILDKLTQPLPAAPEHTPATPPETTETRQQEKKRSQRTQGKQAQN